MMAHIQLKTKIPGPKSLALMEARRAAVPRGPFHATPIFMSRGRGALIEDVDGNTLLDFAAGIGVTTVGHAPDAVVRAIQDQASRVLHTSFNVTPHESYTKLAEKLNRSTPGAFAKKTLLVNSGAEAVENAVKIARAATGRQAVICFDHAFHGRTYMAMALTSKAKPYKLGFAPFPSEVYRAPFPYAYRGVSEDEAFRAFENLVLNQVSPTNTAAVIFEPVLGEGGFIPAPAGFAKRLREFCTQNGIVLIADEIQTGFGRTGTLFACEQLGVAADLVTMAKGLGGGMPIAAVTGRAEMMDAPVEGGIGGTYGGNPVACAAALAVFSMFEENGGAFLEKARKLGETARRRLTAWKELHPVIGEVRGLGPMLGLELVRPGTGGTAGAEPSREAAAALAKYCYEHGVVVLTAGTYGNVVRLLMPLAIEMDQLEEGLKVMEDGFASIKA